jgi:hypothetical protein
MPKYVTHVVKDEGALLIRGLGYGYVTSGKIFCMFVAHSLRRYRYILRQSISTSGAGTLHRTISKRLPGLGLEPFSELQRTYQIVQTRG